MNGVREQRPWAWELEAYLGQVSVIYDSVWESRAGITTWDWLLDVRNIQVASTSVILIKQGIQFAATRVDRPDDVVIIGNGLNAANLYHLTHSPTGISTKAFWRRAITCSLTTLGTPAFARAQGVLYSSCRTNGMALPAEEIVVNPYNNNSAWSIFPLGGGRPIPCRSVDKAGFVAFGQGNVSSTLQYCPYVRAFNDPLKRGDWTAFVNATQSPETGDFNENIGEFSFPVTLANYQWFELGWGVRDTTANTARVVFRVIPSLVYV